MRCSPTDPSYGIHDIALPAAVRTHNGVNVAGEIDGGFIPEGFESEYFQFFQFHMAPSTAQRRQNLHEEKLTLKTAGQISSLAYFCMRKSIRAIYLCKEKIQWSVSQEN